MSNNHTLNAKNHAVTYTPYGTRDEFRVEAVMVGLVIKQINVIVKYKGTVWYHATYKRDGSLIEILCDNSAKG